MSDECKCKYQYNDLMRNRILDKYLCITINMDFEMLNGVGVGSVELQSEQLTECK